MGTSLSQAALASHRITAEDRMERIGQLTTKQLTDALLFLAGYAPATFDAIAEAVEPCAGDGADDPAPTAQPAAATSGSSSSSALIGGTTWGPTYPISNSSTPATSRSSPGAPPACPCSHDQ
jgi:hypothetical protein